jgi:amino acid permease
MYYSVHVLAFLACTYSVQRVLSPFLFHVRSNRPSILVASLSLHPLIASTMIRSTCLSLYSIPWQTVWQDASWFFSTIAVLLGTGILGLPIKLVACGYWPFVFILTLTFFMQTSVVFLMTDTLQHAARLLPAIDLHTMGKHLLGRTGSFIFDFFVLLTFGSILISYTLAAAAALADVLDIAEISVISPFVVVCTSFIILCPRAVKAAVSLFTSAKVAVLVVVIGLVGIVAHSVGVSPHDSWSAFMQPFLVGTVAIGGIVQMMPVMFPLQDMTRKTLQHFRWSIITGILACYLLNLIWARFVLGVVPQTIADAAADGIAESLEQAQAKGDIATIPVTAVISNDFPQFEWIRWTLSAFVITSILVSFNAIGLGLRHVLEGMATTLQGVFPTSFLARDVRCSAPAACTRFARSYLLEDVSLSGVHIIVYILAFFTIWGVAYADPSGFILVLESFTSLALNYSCGIIAVQLNVEVRALAAREAPSGASPQCELQVRVDEVSPLLTSADATHDVQGEPQQESPIVPAPFSLPLELQPGFVVGLGAWALILFGLAIVYDAYSSSTLIVHDGAALVVAFAALLLLLKLNILPSFILGMRQWIPSMRHVHCCTRFSTVVGAHDQLLCEAAALPWKQSLLAFTSFEHYVVMCVSIAISTCAAPANPALVALALVILGVASVPALVPLTTFAQPSAAWYVYIGALLATVGAFCILCWVNHYVAAGTLSLGLVVFIGAPNVVKCFLTHKNRT